MENKRAQQIFWHHHKIAEKDLHKNNETLFGWLFKLRQFFLSGESSADNNDKQFLRFYLASTTNVCIQFLSINILMLLVSVYVIAQKRFGDFHIELDPIFDSLQTSIVEIAIWMLFSALCLLYFLVLRYAPQLFSMFLVTDECEVWYELGASVMTGRFLMLVAQIVTSLSSEDNCLDAADLQGTQDNTFAYMFIKMSIDTYQTYAFAIMPFPQPWAVFFTIMEVGKQEIRLFTCSSRITTEPSQFWIIHLVAFLLVILYVVVLLIPSIYLERSVRNRYKRTLLQQKAEATKQEMVGFLCTDVRVPLQYLLYATTTIDFQEMAGGNVVPLLEDINKYTRTVNDIADDLLLLVRVKENRYTSSLNRVRDLKGVFETMVQSILLRRSQEGGGAVGGGGGGRGSTGNGRITSRSSGSGVRECVVHTTVPTIEVSVDERCLLAVLRHLLIFVTTKPPAATESESGEASISVAGEHTMSQCSTSAKLEMDLVAKVENVSGMFAPRATKENPLSRSGPGGAPSDKFQVLKVSLTSTSGGSGGDVGGGGGSRGASVSKEWDEQRRVHEATTAYICNSIAVSCGGSFKTDSVKSKYELTLPCRTASAVAATALAATPATARSAEEPQVADIQASDEVAPFAAVTTTAAAAADVAVDNQQDAPSGEAANANSPEKEALDAKIKISGEMQSHFQKNRVCVIVEDSFLMNVITNVLRRLHLDMGMAVLHELQAGSIPIAKLTIVTDYQLCVDLRARKYQGRIVLFSGRSSYLDDGEKAILDYCLPLPSSDQHLSQFLDWLIDLHEKEKRRVGSGPEAAARVPRAGVGAGVGAGVRSVRGALRHRHSSAKALLASANAPPTATTVTAAASQQASKPLREELPPNPLAALLLSVYTALRAQWQSEETWFFVTALSPGTVESYYKWKLLNPARSVYHHSSEMFFVVGSRILMLIILEGILFKQPLVNLIPAFICMPMYLIVSCVYQFILKPCGIQITTFWAIVSFATSLTFIYAMISGSFEPPPESYNLTLTEFLNTEFYNNRPGSGYLLSQISSAGFSRVYAVYMTHPLSIVALIMICARASMTNWHVLRTLCTAQMTQFIQLVFVQLLVLNIIYVVHLENTYRREFKTAHKHILDKAFLDQCLEICQQDIRKPLSYLSARQDDLMKVLIHAAYVRSIKIDTTLVAKLEPLHVSRALLNEMVSELTYGRNTGTVSATELLPMVRANMVPIQLHRAVARLISAFSSSAADHHVRIYAEIDTKMAVVLVDWKMLSMLLTNLITVALRNIFDYCAETPRNKDLTNLILLKFTAIATPSKVPFVHPRLMLINVCDSSNAAAKSVARVFKGAVPSAEGGAPGLHSSASSSSSGGGAELRDTLDDDRNVSKYGRSVCEQLIFRAHPHPLFETIAVQQSAFQTAQRCTFTYHLTPQTRKTQDFLEAETDKDFVTICMSTPLFFAAYKRIIYPEVSNKPIRSVTQPKPAGSREVVYLSGMATATRCETIKLIKRFESFNWYCNVKYVLNIPSMHAIGGADCVLIDQQLETLENVNIADTVLKLRVCGFNGVIAVVMQEGLKNTAAIKDELDRSAAEIDVLIMGPLKDQNIQGITVALEKKCIRQLLYLNGN